MITLETLAEVVRPYNEKLIAEARAERLERINAELLAALLPFEELADEGNHDQPDETKVTVDAGRSTCYGLTLADLRRVRIAIRKATGAA